MTILDRSLAGSFSGVALGHVERPYPCLPQLILSGPEDLRAPSDVHPVFFGSLDWHSCVHGYWMLARLLRLFPDHDRAAEVRALFARRLTAEAVAVEVAYFEPALHRGFERPYGWAWLLKLAAELQDHPALGGYAAVLSPLSARIAALFSAFLAKATYPVRGGAHFNTALALLLAHDYARGTPLGAFIEGTALRWYGGDRAAQALEPEGDAFLSPVLVEAALMARVHPDFEAWFAAFLPDLARGIPETLFSPAIVSDPGDGKIAHLDGLNLSRVWCWRRILPALPPDHAARTLVDSAVRGHLHASLGAVRGDYMGEHWLASYAVMALQEGASW